MDSRRQSWPPTQLRLIRSGSGKSIEPRPLLEDIDEDPLTYFLTPNLENDEVCFTSDEDSEDDDDDFDAGIEVAGRPRDLVRSVSPSTLDGLGKPRRAASPDLDSDGLISDDDDEENEDYIRYFSSSPASPPRSPSGLLGAMPRHSFSGYPFGLRPRSPGFMRESGRSSNAFTSSSSSFPAPARPSSAAAAAILRGRAAWAARRGPDAPATRRVSRPGHLWREPSADVWSIEEETEEELTMSETRGRGVARREGGRGSEAAEAKPIKRVRFVLPGDPGEE
ncbi:hypothetical protein BBO_03751 [Beauveria brongniartii RCEF 3172]|uniref:Uncharacterized protein n=1 Tax=Beauveria brongniartii RCEF 3172 TaxID=1081107 RepID=A0A162JPN2_9HYPO|nr:hypothetical protein BBO_03751 [Beauveria brongniartii RCEF 3172]